MLNKTSCIVAAFCLLICWESPGIAADDTDYRTAAKVPPVKIYEGMLKFISTKEYDSVHSMSTAVKPVLQKIKEKFSVDLENELTSALTARDDKKAVSTLLKIVYWDIKDVFSLIKDEKNGKNAVQSWFKMALIDYYLLSPHIISRNQASNDKIIKLYKDISVELGKTETDMPAIVQISKEIENECLSVFPEFAK